jgi:nucleoid DNA-binding protein
MAKKKAAAKKKAMGKKKVTGKKKAVAKKKASKKRAAAAGKKPPTKSEILAHIADETELNKRDVTAVIDSLTGLIAKNIGSRGPGSFNMPGLMKITVKKKPATKARKGINPFTGEEMMFKAKPAKKVVKIAPLKSMKEMV